jgi:hypothetical protein
MASIVRSDSMTPGGDACVGVIVSVRALIGSGVLQTAQTDVPGGLVRPHCGHSMECPDAMSGGLDDDTSVSARFQLSFRAGEPQEHISADHP